jgi:2-hydroxy-3-keto-5-methylthiopentenyl-1-phosphate phosphatase
MVRIYCDFDGTVCLQDVGELFFRSYAGVKAEVSVARLLGGEITMQAWLTELCEAIPSISKEEFNRFVDQFNVDPHFHGFVHFCQERDMPITVLSDGLDAYVERVLLKAGLSQIPFFANHLEMKTVDGRETIAVSFPHTDAECNLCGNCKRNHMLRLSSDEDIIVYIGDGFSDKCPVRYADVVFAKQQLIRYCQEQNITYFEFSHFGDVQARMEEILQCKRIRPRQEAAWARREVFMQG